jgi:hypothetical protein
LAARSPGPSGWLLVVGATGLFLAREPIARLVRSLRHGVRPEVRRLWILWAAGWAGLGLICVLGVVFGYERPGLLWLGFAVVPLLTVHLWLTERREDRSIPAELLGIAALTLTAPAAWYTATGQWVPDGWQLWLLCLLYFSSAVFFVKMQVSRFLRPQRFPQARRLHVAYHLAAILIVTSAIRGWELNAWIAAAYLPILGRSILGTFRGPARLKLKRLGYLEVAYTCWFVFTLGLFWKG